MQAENGRWPISATQWIFGNESVETTADRLARLGYDGIELAGEPDEYSADDIHRILQPRGMRLTSICGTYPAQRDLSHPDADLRAAAVRYIAGCCRLAAALGGSVVIVVPTAVGRVAAVASADQEWVWAVESIREAADAAGGSGVRLVVESLNRYETYLVNSLDRAAQMVHDINRPNVGLMADLFHMNIEEASIPGAIERHRDLVWHVHLADSNRRAPGQGHTNFPAALDVLREIGYTGSLTMEFLPPTANPYIAASLDVPEAEKTADAEGAIRCIRGILSPWTPDTQAAPD